MAELRYNNQSGIIGTTLTAPAAGTSQAITGLFTAVPDFATIVAPDYIKLELDYGTSKFEVVYLTAYTAGSLNGTITRGAEDATNWPPVAHTGGSGTWAGAASVADFAGLAGADVTTVAGSNIVLSATANICPVLVTAGGHTITPGRAPTNSGDILIVTVTQNATGGYAYTLAGFTGAAVYASGAAVSITTSPNAADIYIGVPNEAGTDWIWLSSAEVVLGYLPIQELEEADAITGTVTLSLPATGDTVQTITQASGTTITVANPSTYPPAGYAVSFELIITTFSSGSVTLPAASGTCRYGAALGTAGGAAPTLAVSHVYKFIVSCTDSNGTTGHWDWSFVGQFA